MRAIAVCQRENLILSVAKYFRDTTTSLNREQWILI